MDVSYDQMMPHRNILEIVSDSLKDLPQNVTYDYENEMTHDHVNYTENNVRYKLLIDNSKDDSAVRYLFACDVLDQKYTQMVACSDFSEESGMHVS